MNSPRAVRNAALSGYCYALAGITVLPKTLKKIVLFACFPTMNH